MRQPEEENLRLKKLVASDISLQPLATQLNLQQRSPVTHGSHDANGRSRGLFLGYRMDRRPSLPCARSLLGRWQPQSEGLSLGREGP